jgi:multidrug resistance efflux pump
MDDTPTPITGAQARTDDSPTPITGAQARTPANPIRRLTIIVLVLCIVWFTYSLISNRFTPYTDQATVQAYVVRIAPDINGRIRAVKVIDNQAVKAGDILFEIDPERFQIAVESAKAQLAAAGFAVGASTAALAAAQARVAEAKAKLANAETQSARVFDLVKQGIEPKSKGELAKSSLESAIADVDRTNADVEQARQNLGPQGKDNPQIREAQAALDKSNRDLADTTVRAPSNGVITNLQLAAGQFVAAGQSVMTFIDAEVIWIESHFDENSLEHLKTGDAVDVVLDIRPGRIYPGRIESIGWAVDSRDIDPATGLPTIRNDTGWLRDAQKFAVRIQFDPDTRPRGIRLGSQANVVVYTGNSSITDKIGRLWIILISYLTYFG